MTREPASSDVRVALVEVRRKPLQLEALRTAKPSTSGMVGEVKSGNTYKAMRRAGLARKGYTVRGADGKQWWQFELTEVAVAVARKLVEGGAA